MLPLTGPWASHPSKYSSSVLSLQPTGQISATVSTDVVQQIRKPSHHAAVSKLGHPSGYSSLPLFPHPV